MTYSGKVMLLAALFVSAFTSCSQQTSKVPYQADAGAQSPPQVGEPLNASECEEFAEQFLAKLRAGDAPGATALWDHDALLNRATGGIDAPPGLRDWYHAQLRERHKQSGGIVGMLLKSIGSGANIRKLRCRSVEGESRALLRLVDPAGAVTYLDFVLVRGDGVVRAVDFHALVAGELFSHGLRREYLMMVANESGGVLEKLTGVETDWVKHHADMKRLMESMETQPQEAQRIYRSLPERLRNEKTLLLLHMSLASASGDDETYFAALERFRELHPKDPAIDLLSIDSYAAKGDFAQALAAIDRVDKQVEGDIALNLYRSTVHLLAQRFDQARELAQNVIVAEPDLVSAYWLLVRVSLAEQDFDETLRLLKTIAERFGTPTDDFARDEEYAGFIKSVQYDEWRKFVKNR